MEQTPKQKATIVDMVSESIGKIREMIDVNTVVGEAITTPDGTTIIPVSKMSMGFGSGGSDWGGSTSQKSNFGGGAGAGIKITPVSFLVINASGVKVLSMQPGELTGVEKLIDAIPSIIDKAEELIYKYKG